MYYSLQLNRKTLCARVLRSELSDFVRSFEGICLLKLILFARQVQKRNIICAILRFTSKDSNARCFFHTLFPHKSPVLTYIDMIGSANELPHTIWGKGLSFFMRLFPNSKENFIVHFWDLLPKFNESFIYKITKKNIGRLDFRNEIQPRNWVLNFIWSIIKLKLPIKKTDFLPPTIFSNSRKTTPNQTQMSSEAHLPIIVGCTDSETAGSPQNWNWILF